MINNLRKFIQNGLNIVLNVRKGDNDMKVNIVHMTDGTFAVVDPNGQAVNTYSRARDARRGAIRRGFVPVN